MGSAPLLLRHAPNGVDTNQHTADPQIQLGVQQQGQPRDQQRVQSARATGSDSAVLHEGIKNTRGAVVSDPSFGNAFRCLE